MTDAQILDVMKRALHDVEPDRDDDWSRITLDVAIDQLELDSVKTLEMIGFLEEETGAVFEDDQLSVVRTLRDLATLIQAG